MATQGVNFGFTSTGADDLAKDFRKVGDNSVIAAKGARLCADALEKQRKAANVSAGATIALAKADDILKEAEHGLAEGALEAEFALKQQADAAKKAGVESAAASAGVSALAGAGGIPGGGMGALIAAGTLLSPVIATLGVGLGGLGLAAFGVSRNTKLMAAELAPLKAEFAGFTKALQPTILSIFNTGIKTAGGLLRDIQPVAQATGKAFGGFLGQIDAEFKSRTWQDFFGFMAAQAGPDMKLLAGAILPLLDTLPKLLTDIQPIAVEFLKAAGGAARLADAAVTLNERIQHLGTQADHSGGLMGHLADAGKKALDQMLPGIPAAQALGKWLGTLGDNSDKAGKSTDKAGEAFKGAWPKAQSYAQWVTASAKATTALADAQDAAVSKQLTYGNAILTSANDAQTFHDKLKASANQIGLHTQAQRDSFGAANTYIGDLSRQATAAISSGHGTDAAIGAIRRGLPALESAKTHNRQYWEEVRTLVNYLHQLSLQKFINTGIHVTGAGRWSVTGTTITPGVAHGPQNIGAAPGFAAGGRVPFSTGTPGRDSVLVVTKPGEIFIPPEKGPMLAPALSAAGIPGFAAGGVAGSYGPGRVSGLPRWTSGRIDATMAALAQNTAQATLNAMAAAQASAKAAAASSPGVSGAGPVGGDAGANLALARSMFPWPASQWPAFNTLEMHEAGYNRFARNPSSGAYGIPQALPPTKMPFAAQAGGGSHAGPQLSWMFSYIRGQYGTPANAWAKYYAHPGGVGWYGKGGIVPGYASGGTVGQQGQAYLNAWRSRRGGPYALAIGPKTLNQQIPAMAAAYGRARTLAGAGGLSPGQHRFWANAAASEGKLLATLRKELATERTWRYHLGLDTLALDREIRTAGNLPGLAGPVRGWKRQLAARRHTIGEITAMIGPGAPAKPKPKPPGVPGSIPHTGAYTDRTADLIAQLFAASAALTRTVTLDSGGTLAPGWNAAYNGTGRPEPLIPASRGGAGGTIVLSNHGVIGSQAQLEDWLVRSIDSLKRKRRL